MYLGIFYRFKVLDLLYYMCPVSFNFQCSDLPVALSSDLLASLGLAVAPSHTCAAAASGGLT